MLKNKRFYKYLMILYLFMVILSTAPIKAQTYQVNDFNQLKSAIESAPAGNHNVIITNDIVLTNQISILDDVHINLTSDNIKRTISRTNLFYSSSFMIKGENASLSITNVIIDGKKELFDPALHPVSYLFSLQKDTSGSNPNFSGSLSIGKDVVIKNVGGRNNSCIIIYNVGGSVTLKDNADFYNNGYTTKGNSLVCNALDDDRSQLIIQDNVKFHDNVLDGTMIVVNWGQTIIKDNVEFYQNESTSNSISGVFTNMGYGTMSIEGNVKIHDNKAIYTAIGVNYNKLTIKDNVDIYNNVAAISYGLYNTIQTTYPPANGHVELIIQDHVKIHDNEAITGYAPAISLNNDAISSISDYVEITNNKAGYDGGAIYLYNKANLVIQDHVKITNNLANHHGGALYVRNATLTIKDLVSITDNEAALNGGAIYTEDYHDLMIAQEVIFKNNKAQVGYNEDLPSVDPLNYAIYDTNIKVPNNKWSTNRTYGYNNYDINYQAANETFIVHYDANGGQGAVPADGAYHNNDLINVDFNSLPTKAQARFIGWSLNSSDTKPLYEKNNNNSFVMGTNNITLYAIYVPTYQITTSVIGGTIDKSLEAMQGENIKINFKGNEGYLLKEIIVDDKTINLNNLQNNFYEFLNITDNHKISVIFIKKTEQKNRLININNDNNDSPKIILPQGGNNLLNTSIIFIIMILPAVMLINKNNTYKQD
ncbi:MAG: InlB B-repeat-containing protein [Bacilli bacterium]|jgi:predicted outer membrane repeat protein|nr:InlB B-repeat-containing protein [Bacilli bacterium]